MWHDEVIIKLGSGTVVPALACPENKLAVARRFPSSGEGRKRQSYTLLLMNKQWLGVLTWVTTLKMR